MEDMLGPVWNIWIPTWHNRAKGQVLVDARYTTSWHTELRSPKVSGVPAKQFKTQPTPNFPNVYLQVLHTRKNNGWLCLESNARVDECRQPFKATVRTRGGWGPAARVANFTAKLGEYAYCCYIPVIRRVTQYTYDTFCSLSKEFMKYEVPGEVVYRTSPTLATPQVRTGKSRDVHFAPPMDSAANSNTL